MACLSLGLLPRLGGTQPVPPFFLVFRKSRTGKIFARTIPADQDIRTRPQTGRRPNSSGALSSSVRPVPPDYWRKSPSDQTESAACPAGCHEDEPARKLNEWHKTRTPRAAPLSTGKGRVRAGARSAAEPAGNRRRGALSSPCSGRLGRPHRVDPRDNMTAGMFAECPEDRAKVVRPRIAVLPRQPHQTGLGSSGHAGQNLERHRRVHNVSRLAQRRPDIAVKDILHGFLDQCRPERGVVPRAFHHRIPELRRHPNVIESADCCLFVMARLDRATRSGTVPLPMARSAAGHDEEGPRAITTRSETALNSLFRPKPIIWTAAQAPEDGLSRSIFAQPPKPRVVSAPAGHHNKPPAQPPRRPNP